MLGKSALAGMIATLPMTLFMLFVQRFLPKWQHYDLPPEKITDELAERANVKKHLDKPKRVGVALTAHFGYGAAMGVLYPFFAKIASLPLILRGIIFGLGVWAASYLGLLPALQMKAPATHLPLQRNVLMIVAHVIWGAALDVFSR